MIAPPRPSAMDTAVQHGTLGNSPWHTVEPDVMALRLETASQGLTQDEARRRLERDGPNELAETPPTSPLIVPRIDSAIAPSSVLAPRTARRCGASRPGGPGRRLRTRVA
jgi:hypothetical protein